jgi:hypothetical protein
MVDLADMNVVASATVAVCDIDQGLALLDMERNVYFSLNATGAVAWRAIEKPKSLGEICSAIAEHFDIAPQVCREDVLRLLTGLIEAKLAYVVDG